MLLLLLSLNIELVLFDHSVPAMQGERSEGASMTMRFSRDELTRV